MLGDELRVALGMALERARQQRHDLITLEHLLFGLLHDPDASEVLEACGADLKEIESGVERALEALGAQPDSGSYEPKQTKAFQRVLARAMNHVESTGKYPVTGANVLVAIFAEPESQAAYLLGRQGITRLKVVEYLSHGVRGDGKPRKDRSEPASAGGDDEESGGRSGDALADYTVDLWARAEAGRIDPLIGRANEVERAIQVLARRRKNNPLFIGDSGVG